MNTDQASGPDRDFLEYAVRAIVDQPNDVIVTRSVDELGVLITLRVNKDDMSKIIGKSGRTAKALRTLLRVVGSKHDFRVNLKILEPDGSEYRVPEEGREMRAPHRPPRPARKFVAKPEAKVEDTNIQADGNDGSSAFDNII